MTTIAKLVAEIGGDPTGLTAALRESTGAINSFVSTTSSSFQKIGKGVNLENFVGDAIKNLKSGLTSQLGQIRGDLFRKIIDPKDATAAGVEAAVQFNEGLARTINALEASGRANIGPLRAKLAKEFLEIGKLSSAQLAVGLKTETPKVEAAANAIATRSGRSFAQTLTATIHRHRALIPTLTGLLLSEVLSGAGEASKATAGLNAVDAAAEKATQSMKAAEKILHEFGMLASFILPPVPGLIVAVTSGIIGAVIGIHNKVKEELVKMRQTFVSELTGMVDQIDQIGLQKKLEEILQGKRSGGASQFGNFFRGGLSDLQARQQRDLNSLKALGLDLEKGTNLVGKTLTDSQQDLISAVQKRQPLIDELKRQAAEITDALLNPEQARAGFGGQLPAMKIAAKGPGGDTAFKDLEKNLQSLMGVFQAETAVGRESFDVLLKIRDAVISLNTAIEKSDPLSEKTLQLRALRGEVEKTLGSVLKLQGAFQGAATTTPNLAPAAKTIFDLDKISRQIIIQGGQRVVDQFGIEVKLLTKEMTPLKVHFAELKDGLRAAVIGLRDALVGIGGRILSALNPLALFSRVLDESISAIIPSLEALTGPLGELAAVVANALKPVFDALAPVLKAITPVIGAVLQVLGPILAALVPIIGAFVPILRALFPLFKMGAIVATYLFQAFATGAAIFLRAIGNIIIGWGTILKALAVAIDKLPFVSAKNAINAAEGVINFGRALLNSSDEFAKSAEEMARARDTIRDLSIDDTQDAINDLGTAAAATAGVLNGPQGFRVELLRFMAQTARNAARLSPADRGGGSGQPDDPSKLGGTLVDEGDLNIDAKRVRRAQLFDAIRRGAAPKHGAEFRNRSARRRNARSWLASQLARRTSTSRRARPSAQRTLKLGSG